MMNPFLFFALGASLSAQPKFQAPADPIKGFSKTPMGLPYKIITHGNGRPCKVGDLIMFSNKPTTLKDSLISPVQEASVAQVAMPQHGQDPNELFAMLHVGDSAVFLLSIDTITKGSHIPPPFKPGDFLKVTIKIKKAFATMDEYNAYQKKTTDSMNIIANKNLETYITKNNIKATKTSSGLYYIIESQGTGMQAGTGKRVKVKYKGYLLDGTVFDPGTQPIEITLGNKQVIPGWEEGLAYFSEGSKGKLIIPSALAYGERGAGKFIAPYSNLIFEVEMLSVSQPADNNKEILDYLAKNHINAKPTGSGLYYVVDKEGTGALPAAGKKVKVNYKGYTLDGKVFDASTNPGREPFEFVLGGHQVIGGWDEGIALFKVGSTGRLFIPSKLGYGEAGSPPTIPGNAVLIFEIEVLGTEQ